MNIELIFEFVGVLLFVGIMNFFHNKIKSKVRYIIIAVLKLILAIAFAVLVMAGPLFLRPVQPLLIAFYIVFFADTINDVIFIFIKRKTIIKRIITSSILSIIFMSYGFINMQIVRQNETTFYSDKITNDYDFVFISDVHTGSSQSLETTIDTFNKIKELDIDFLVLGGDITDDYTTNEEMHTVFETLKDSSFPIYYIYGNHDRQLNASYANGRTYTEDELIETLTTNNITILKDTYVDINNDLVILGREDMSMDTRLSDTSLTKPDSSKYFVVFDHQPFDENGISYLNPDLQVSGHTHAGQFFPLNLFYNLVIGPSYGLYTINNTKLLVSSGASGWRVPCRTDHFCEYELIHLRHN